MFQVWFKNRRAKYRKQKRELNDRESGDKSGEARCDGDSPSPNAFMSPEPAGSSSPCSPPLDAWSRRHTTTIDAAAAPSSDNDAGDSPATVIAADNDVIDDEHDEQQPMLKRPRIEEAIEAALLKSTKCGKNRNRTD